MSRFEDIYNKSGVSIPLATLATDQSLYKSINSGLFSEQQSIMIIRLADDKHSKGLFKPKKERRHFNNKR